MKPTAPATIHLRTLGCKVNQYESQALREAWTAQGHTLADDPENADLVVFNSCAVTSKAVQDLRTQVRQVHRANPQAAIVLAGCAAQVLPQELSRLPGVAAVLPQAQKSRLLTDPGAIQTFVPAESSRTVFPPFSICDYRRARAVCKVQDGCSQGCSYCIVPLARGPAVSRPPAQVVAEVRRLLAAGFREITLAGINLNQYGRGLEQDLDFWDLLALLEAELAPDWAGHPQRARLRISSLDPAQLTDKGLQTLAASRLVAPHLHVSLQSMAPDVLVRMGRRATDPDAVFRFLEKLRSVWPRFAMGADLLAGFPGETGQDAAQTLAAVRDLPLTYAHVFPYSPRPGTRAANMPGRVPGPLARERAKTLRNLTQHKKETFAATLAAEAPTLYVAVERADEHGWRGTCQYYVECQGQSPDKAPDALRRLAPARPTAALNGGGLAVKLQT